MVGSVGSGWDEGKERVPEKLRDFSAMTEHIGWGSFIWLLPCLLSFLALPTYYSLELFLSLIAPILASEASGTTQLYHMFESSPIKQA